MGIADGAGLAGVAIILIAYASAALGRLKPTSAPAHAMNFVGAALILVSLAHDFNLSAVVMEAAWALIAVLGLVRIALKR